MAGSGRRFALEALFLVGLAVAAGLAELSAGQIIGVMALGWLLTALVELVSWRLAIRRLAAPVAPPVVENGAEPAVVTARGAAEPPDQPEPAVATEAVEEEPQAADASEDAAEVSEDAVDAPADEEPVVVGAEAVGMGGEDEQGADDGAGAGDEPRRRRRRFWRRRSEPDEVGVVPLERPSRRHVRLISGPREGEDEDTAERRIEER